MTKTVLSSLAVDRCTAFALEAIEAHLSPENVVPKGKLTDHERSVLADHIRAGFAEAFASNWGSEHTRERIKSAKADIDAVFGRK